MSACSDFVEHIWKPGSCKNCFCLRSDHQLTAGHPKARASSLPAGARLPARPEICRLEDEGVNGLAYSKPTIAVKPTMMTSETADLWTEASLSTEVPKVRLTNPAGIFTGAVPILAHGGWHAATQGFWSKNSCRVVAYSLALKMLLPDSCCLATPIIYLSMSSFRLTCICPHTSGFLPDLETYKRESKNKDKEKL